jgi:hypothetical protein
MRSPLGGQITNLESRPHVMRFLGLVPITASIGDADRPFAERARKVLSEIASTAEYLSHPVLSAWATGTTSVSVTALRGESFPAAHPKYRELVATPRGMDISAYIIEVQANLEPAEDGEAVEVVEDVELWKSVVHSLLEDMGHLIVFAANLANPGAISTGRGIWLVDDERYTDSALLSADYVRFAVQHAERTTWPTISQLHFADAWNWIVRNGFPIRCGDTPASRAYSAFTHLMAGGSGEAPLRLALALHGVEALFCTSTTGVQNQVSERAQLLLGEQKTFKSDLGRMYSTRSALLHGAHGFPALHFPFRAPPGYERRRAAVEHGADVASAILIASLQQLVVRQWSLLKFHTALEGTAVKFDPESVADECSTSFVRYNSVAVENWLRENIAD